MNPADRGSDALVATDLHIEATYRLTEALVDAENRMRRRVELLSEIVFEVDPHGCIIFLNESWHRILGSASEDCMGRPLCDYVADDDRERCRRALKGNVDGESAARPLIRWLRQDGGIVWMEMSLARIADGSAVGALHDVTQQKLVQDEVAKLSLVASYTDNLVVITDRAGRTEWVNQAFERKTGYSLADLVGRKPGEVLQGPDTDRDAATRVGELVHDGQSFSAELLNYTRPGDPYWVRFHVTPIRNANGDIERFVSIQTDSTELHRTQEQLRAAKEHAESANEAKTQFLATISHEMRTPLNAILGSVELALDGERDPQVLRAHMTRVSDGAEALLRLITDLLDLSKIEAGQMDVETTPFDIRTCLQGAVAPIAERARAKGLDFKFMCDESLPAQMIGDPDRLRQIVSNLVENAVKFTDSGYVRVEASRIATTNGVGPALEIRVIDSGVGIPPDALKRIFERFVQGDSSITRRKGGAGLGLNIVQSLAEALGGSVRVDSSLGHGADFRVTLPIVEASEASDVPLKRALQTESSRAAALIRTERILVAEDTDANFAVLSAYLTKDGYAVTRARNGWAAIEAAQSCDLVIMDIEMPDMDGIEATRRIRAKEYASGLKPIPVLALTAHAVQEYRERCIAAGCTGYLSKPVRMNTLLEAVRAALDA